LEEHLGARLHRRRPSGRLLEGAVELDLPGALRRAAAGPRADDGPRRVEAEDRPKADAEAADPVAPRLLARGVEGEEEAAGVLVAHPLAVVAAAEPGARRLLAGGDLDPGRAGVAGVLEELTDEDPGVRAVAVGLDAGAGAEVVARP